MRDAPQHEGMYDFQLSPSAGLTRRSSLGAVLDGRIKSAHGESNDASKHLFAMHLSMRRCMRQNNFIPHPEVLRAAEPRRVHYEHRMKISVRTRPTLSIGGLDPPIQSLRVVDGRSKSAHGE